MISIFARVATCVIRNNANNDIQLKMRALQKLGHPYKEADIEAAPASLDGLKEIDALIRYLQMLGSGSDQFKKPKEEETS